MCAFSLSTSSEAGVRQREQRLFWVDKTTKTTVPHGLSTCPSFEKKIFNDDDDDDERTSRWKKREKRTREREDRRTGRLPASQSDEPRITSPSAPYVDLSCAIGALGSPNFFLDSVGRRLRWSAFSFFFRRRTKTLTNCVEKSVPFTPHPACHRPRATRVVVVVVVAVKSRNARNVPSEWARKRHTSREGKIETKR